MSTTITSSLGRFPSTRGASGAAPDAAVNDTVPDAAWDKNPDELTEADLPKEGLRGAFRSELTESILFGKVELDSSDEEVGKTVEEKAG